jgi:flavin-binding protein dodecin
VSESAYHVIHLIGFSADSWELAAHNAVHDASEAYRDLGVADVVQMDVVIDDGIIVAFRAQLRLSYREIVSSTGCQGRRQAVLRRSPRQLRCRGWWPRGIQRSRERPTIASSIAGSRLNSWSPRVSDPHAPRRSEPGAEHTFVRCQRDHSRASSCRR